MPTAYVLFVNILSDESLVIMLLVYTSLVMIYFKILSHSHSRYSPMVHLENDLIYLQ